MAIEGMTLRALSIAMGAVALMLASASPAPASTGAITDASGPPPSDCHIGQLVLYGDVGFDGHRWVINDHLHPWSVPVFDSDFNNKMSSWCNRSGQVYCVSDGFYGGNPDNTMPNNTWGNFTTTGWNDRASSLGYLGCP
jgi:hypothetical protein